MEQPTLEHNPNPKPQGGNLTPTATLNQQQSPDDALQLPNTHDHANENASEAIPDDQDSSRFQMTERHGNVATPAKKTTNSYGSPAFSGNSELTRESVETLETIVAASNA